MGEFRPHQGLPRARELMVLPKVRLPGFPSEHAPVPSPGHGYRGRPAMLGRSAG